MLPEKHSVPVIVEPPLVALSARLRDNVLPLIDPVPLTVNVTVPQLSVNVWLAISRLLPLTVAITSKFLRQEPVPILLGSFTELSSLPAIMIFVSEVPAQSDPL